MGKLGEESREDTNELVPLNGAFSSFRLEVGNNVAEVNHLTSRGDCEGGILSGIYRFCDHYK